MVDYSILGDVLDLFPEATAAADKYKAAKPDPESRSIARCLTSEAALYGQFTRKVLLLSNSVPIQNDGLHQHVVEWLGARKTDLLTASLKEMQWLLRTLVADLGNTRRGTEVLDKLGPREASTRPNAPNTALQKRLDKLSTLNTYLAAYLLPPQGVPLPFPDRPPLATSIQSFFHHDRKKPAEAAQAISTAYKCDCQRLHLAGLRCACSKCNPEFQEEEPEPGADEWAFEVAFRPGTEQNCCLTDSPVGYARSAALMPEKNMATWISPLSLEDKTQAVLPPIGLCSLLKVADEQAFGPGRHLGTLEKSTRTFLTFDELSRCRSPQLDQNKRMALAFRLSSAVLQFASTPFADEPRRLKDWVVAIDGGQRDEPPNVFIFQNLFTSPDSAKAAPLTESKWGITTRDPILTRLGLALVELALCQALSDIRKEEPDLLDEKETNNYDPELLDLFTARKLLSLRHIAQAISPDFQDVVSACITQQYRDRRDARIKELDTRDASFLEHATVAILMPLYQEARKYLGYNHIQLPNNKTPRAETKHDYQRYATKHTELKTRKPFSSPRRRTTAPTNDTLRPSQPPSLRPGTASGSHGDDAIDGITRDKSTEMTLPAQPSGDEREHCVDSFKVIKPSTNALGCDNPPVLVTPHFIEDQGLPGETSKLNSGLDLPTPQPIGDHEPGPIEKDEAETHEMDSSIVCSVAQSCESDAISSWSYGTYTESTDSAFAWLPDSQHQVYRLPADHPLLGFSEVALQVLLRDFRMWTEAGGDGTAASRQAASTFGSQASSTKGYTGSTKKRPRVNMDRSTGQGEDDEEDEGPEQRSKISRKRSRIENSIFACPFLKKDPIAHPACCGYSLRRIRDVKQHLGRKHSMPIYCPSCIETFEYEDQRDAHVRDAGCTQRPLAKPEGITEAQKRQLAKKSPANQTLEEQWYGIFDTLFPDHDSRPRSPYMDKALLRSSTAYQGFLEDRGPGILCDFLESHGVITWNLPHGERDLTAFQHQIFRNGFRAIFDQWTHRGGTAFSSSDSLPTTSAATTSAPTQGSSEMGQVTPLSFDQTPAGLDFGHPFVPHAHNISVTGQYVGHGNAYMIDDVNAILDMQMETIGSQDVDMFSWFSTSEHGQIRPP